MSQEAEARRLADIKERLVDGKPLPLGEIAVGLVSAAVCAGAAMWFATRMLRTFRRRGFVTRFS